MWSANELVGWTSRKWHGWLKKTKQESGFFFKIHHDLITLSFVLKRYQKEGIRIDSQQFRQYRVALPAEAVISTKGGNSNTFSE